MRRRRSERADRRVRGLGVGGRDRPERDGARDAGRIHLWCSLLAATSLVALAVGDWMYGAGRAAQMFGRVLGSGLFFGLWFFAGVCVRDRSGKVRRRPKWALVQERGRRERHRRAAPSDGRGPLTLPAWTRVAFAWPLAFALAGLAAVAVGIVEWRIAGAAAVEAFWMLFVAASLTGAFLWIRLAALRARAGGRAAAETATEVPEWAAQWARLSMACPPLLAALAVSAPLVGIERGTVVRLGLVTASKIVLFAVFSFSLYRGGRFLWRRSGEVLSGLRWSREAP